MAYFLISKPFLRGFWRGGGPGGGVKQGGETGWGTRDRGGEGVRDQGGEGACFRGGDAVSICYGERCEATNAAISNTRPIV